MQTLDDLLIPEVEVRLAETRKEIERELAEWGALPEDVKRAQKEISESRWEDLDKAIRTALAKREPMDLRSVDIPHGTIVLEK